MPRVPKSISKNEKYFIYMNIVLTSLRRLARRSTPTQTTAKAEREYNKKWKNWSTANYLLEGNTDTRLSTRNGFPVISRQIDYRKNVLEKIADSINSLQPESVLEIGSGNGLNILCLAVMCPTVKMWTGVELTEAGVTAAKRYLEKIPFESVAYVTKIPKNEIAKKIAGANITFEKGDMNKLPFNDNSYEFVFSFHVLEQVPSTYKTVLGEVHRVTSKYATFFEFFNDGQNIFQRLHISNRGFFKGNSRDVEPAGFQILRFETSDLQQIAFSGCFLLCSADKINNSDNKNLEDK